LSGVSDGTTSRPGRSKETGGISVPPRLRIRDFAHIADIDITFGDLTVLVGPQASGKSLALQWLKIALDGQAIVGQLRSAGHLVDRSDALIDLIFGTGMAAGWRDQVTRVEYDGSRITLNNLGRRGTRAEALFFVPAHRSVLISDGWAAPFQKLSADTPVVARLFSQNLFDRFSGKDAGTLFPVAKRLKQEIRDKIDAAVFHGGQVGIEEDRQRALRLRLVHDDMRLPFMTWTAGQREFTPLLMGLYHLLPRTNQRKRKGTDWVVIEEPEMGLHPQAITAFLLLVLDLMWRGYRVVLATHSPHVLALPWLMKVLQETNADWKFICRAFDVKPKPMRAVSEAALKCDYRTYMMQFGDDGKVRSLDISDLDPGSDDERVAGWGGLTSYVSRFADAARDAVNESAN
jgi:hypothetical protein